MIKNYQEIPLSKLKECTWNYKTDDEELAEKLANNIERNGQIENIIVREISKGKYEVVNGNHRYKALKKLKVKTAVCYNLGKIDEALAKRIAIETNETKFGVDSYLLANLIEELKEEYTFDDIKTTLPYDDLQYDALADLANFDIDNLQEEDEPPDQVSASSGNKLMVFFREGEEDRKDELILYLDEQGLKYKDY